MSKLGDFLNDMADEGGALADMFGEKIIDELAGMAAEEAIKTAGEILTGSPGDTGQQPSLKPSCGFDFSDQTENLFWGYGSTNGEPNPFMLSVPSDHFTESEALTVIHPGQFYGFNFQVLKVGAGGEYAHAIQVLAVEGENSESGWMLNFASGRDELLSGSMRIDNQFVGDDFGIGEYEPGQTNQLTLIYDAKEPRIILVLNKWILEQWIVPGALTPRTIKIRVVGMDVYFLGA